MTEPLGNSGEVRAALRAIVSDASLGPTVLSDRNLMAGVIKDYLPDAPRETGILLAAVEHGVPAALRERVKQGMDAQTAINVTASWFTDLTMYAPEASRWAVSEFALALGLSAPAEPGLQGQSPRQPQPPTQPPQSLPLENQFQSQPSLQPQPQYRPEPQTQAPWQSQPQPSPQFQAQPQFQWTPQAQPPPHWQGQQFGPPQPQPQFAAAGTGDMTVVPGGPGPYQQAAPPIGPYQQAAPPTGPYQQAAPPTGPGQPRRRRRTLPFVIVGVVVVLIAGGVTGALLLGSKPKPHPGPQVKPVASISASSAVVVGGDVVVIYHGGRFAHAAISGKVSHIRAGEVAKLIAVPFPFKSSQARFVGSRSISGTSETVTFSVTPSLETQYFIAVYASSSAAKPLASSDFQNVYVTAAYNVKFGYSQRSCNALSCSHLSNCTRPECYVNYLVRVHAPPSAIKTEEAKRFYHYFALNLSHTGRPTVPKTLFLSRGVKPSVTKIIAPNEYELVVPTEFHVGNEGYSFKYSFCVRDTLSTDGLGLPGHHGCGDSSVPVSTRYLG
jgi:hypothetical protein